MDLLGSRVTIAKSFLKDLSARPEDVHRSLWDLSTDDLYYFELGLILANLRVALAKRRPHSGLFDVAIECTRRYLWGSWEFYSFLSNVAGVHLGYMDSNTVDDHQDQPRSHPLFNWTTSGLEGLLHEGRGAIICSFHFGMFRFLGTAIALLGYQTVCALDSTTYQSTSGLIEAAKSRAASAPQSWGKLRNIVNFSLLDVHDTVSTLRLVRALRRGALVLLFVDGNRGLDSSFGEQSREMVRLLDREVFVKNGAARIAAAAEVPILPVVAARASEGQGQIIAGNPILVRDDADARRSAMSQMYAFLGQQILRSPQDWEGCRLLHQWQPPVGTSERNAFIPEGVRYRLIKGRVTVKRVGNKTLWLDLATRRAYPVVGTIEQSTGLFSTLCSPQGADALTVTDGMIGDSRNQVLLLMGHLLRDGAIRVV